jgi:hypothetical protein
MVFLLRILGVAFVVWLICYFFYSLGKKSALEDLERHRKQGRNVRRGRKVVESSVVEKENHDDDDKC